MPGGLKKVDKDKPESVTHLLYPVLNLRFSSDKNEIMSYFLTKQVRRVSLANDINGLRGNLMDLYISEIF
jgi:hypothetical protein